VCKDGTGTVCTRTGTSELHVLDDKYLAFWYRYDQRDHSIEYVL
jgi:hypothetical protein